MVQMGDIRDLSWVPSETLSLPRSYLEDQVWVPLSSQKTVTVGVVPSGCRVLYDSFALEGEVSFLSTRVLVRKRKETRGWWTRTCPVSVSLTCLLVPLFRGQKTYLSVFPLRTLWPFTVPLPSLFPRTLLLGSVNKRPNTRVGTRHVRT